MRALERIGQTSALLLTVKVGKTASPCFYFTVFIWAIQILYVSGRLFNQPLNVTYWCNFPRLCFLF